MGAEQVTTPIGDGQGLPRVPLGFVPSPKVSPVFAAFPPLVVFRAPRGFGKTSTASYWLRHSGTPHHDRVWVNVPNRAVSRDDFWALVHRRMADAGLPGDVDTWDAIEQLMYTRRRPLVIAIDGFHHVVDHAVDEELLDLVSHHENIHLIVMTRVERPIETLAAITADSPVFRTSDLALEPADVATLATATGRVLSTEEAHHLCAELVGWPAIIRAVLLETSRAPDGTLLVDWSVVERYLRLLLADADMAAYRDVLSTLAVPDEFAADLADLLVGTDTVRRFLPRIGSAGIFTTTFVDGKVSYAYPPTIRDAVVRIFREQDPDGYRETNRRLSQWYVSRGEPERALAHAVNAEDWDHAAEIIEAYWVELVSAHPEQVRNALEHVPAGTVRGSARLLVARDYILNVDNEERSLTAIRTGLLEADADFSRVEDVRLSLGQVLALRSAGQYEVAREIVERQRVDLLADESEWTEEVLAEMPELLLQWSITRLFTADAVAAAYAFREAYRWARERGEFGAKREASSGLALSLAMLGHLPSAERWLRRIAALPSGAGDQPTVLETVSARLVRDIADLDTLRLERDESWVGLVLPAGLADLRAVALLVQAARALHGTGSSEMIGILESYRQQHVEARHGAGLAENLTISALADLGLATGQTDRVRTLLAGVPPTGMWLQMSHAQHALSMGEYVEALRLTEGASAHAGTRPRLAMHLALIHASAAHRLQRVDQAADALHLAIAVAEQTGILRPFLLVPRQDLLDIAAAMPLAAEFLRRPELVAGPEVFPPPLEAVKLSERELRVLREIAPGLSLSHAARRLYVSENTIKTQIRNIYRKLGVHTRKGAIERARELGLLPAVPGTDG